MLCRSRLRSLTLRGAATAAVLCLPLASSTAGQNTNLDVWLAAVERHQPGTWDDAAEAVSRWSTSQLEAIRRSLPLGRGRPANMNDILIRGAILHGDIAMFAPGGYARRAEPGGLLRPQQVLLNDDGRNVGAGIQAIDWAFARQLIDSVDMAVPPTSPTPPGRHAEVVRLWYRATLAHMALHGHYAQARSHLAGATAMFPHDPEVQFARGWLNESFAAPATRAVVDALAIRPAPAGRVPIARPTPDVPPIDTALAAAEKAYSAALASAPDFVEARIHRARVMLLRGRTADAVAELQTARSNAREPFLTYLAALFLAGALEQAEDYRKARDAYEDAAALFPLAQSPMLGLSRVAMRMGDRAEALRHVQGVTRIPEDPELRGDPWWIYPVGPGRHAPVWMAELHRAVAR